MVLDTNRAFGCVKIDIRRERCLACGTCVRICPAEVLNVREGVLVAEPERGVGCLACGQCVCVCPRDAIEVSGRDLTRADAVLPDGERADYPHLRRLLLGRRSVRRFRDEPVSSEDVDRILEAAATAPMGFPPSHVGVLVARDRERVQQLRRDLLPGVRGMRKVMRALRPLHGLMLGREAAQGFRRFIMPIAQSYEDHDARGEDVFFYDAPLALHFYGRALADPADPVIAATLAMVAAEALGLGTCVLGFPGPLLRQSAKLRRKYGLPEKIQPGMCLAIGHPAVKFGRAIRRRFVEIRAVA
ncbi:MAG: nitroreductase family protein [Deltaproteobacteria bacterium]|nr:nitroreductase family protein [Deltaproteobacteria bacterium]